VVPFLGNLFAIATVFCQTRFGVVLILAAKYQRDTTTRYWVIAIFIWIRYVTFRAWTLTFIHWTHVTWSNVCA